MAKTRSISTALRTTDDRWRIIRWGVIATFLITPLIAMQFTTSVNWTLFDFATAAALLIGANVIYETVLRHVTPAWHGILGAVILLAAALLWAEGAVGVFT